MNKVHILCQISRNGMYTLTDESTHIFEIGSCIEVVEGESRLNPNTAWHATLEAYDEAKHKIS